MKKLIVGAAAAAAGVYVTLRVLDRTEPVKDMARLFYGRDAEPDHLLARIIRTYRRAPRQERNMED